MSNFVRWENWVEYRILDSAHPFQENVVQRLESDDLDEAVEKAPVGAYAFVRLSRMDRGSERPPPSGEFCGGTYYLGGTIYSLERLEDEEDRLPGKFSALIETLKTNGWTSAIKARSGGFDVFTDRDSYMPFPKPDYSADCK